MTCKKMAASRTVRAMGPWHEKFTGNQLPMPVSRRGTRPWVGLIPYTPQRPLGMRMEPPPSLPWAMELMPAATDAAAPPLDPPLVRPVSHGFRQSSPSRFSVVAERPNSGVLVFPRLTAPAPIVRSTTMSS